MSAAFLDSHRYGDGRCAQLEWRVRAVAASLGTADHHLLTRRLTMTEEGFQIHFVEQYHKHEGGQTVQETEEYLTQLPGRDGMTGGCLE